MREKYLWNGKRQLSRADRSHINYFAASSGVDFINVLKAAFAHTDPEDYEDLSVFLRFWDLSL